MIATATGYAATALGLLARAKGKPVFVRDLARETGISPTFLAKIVHQLARKRIVATRRGIGGGVILVKGTEELTLLNLCEALDDPVIRPTCLLSEAECSDERACPAHDFWHAQRTNLIQFLSRTTIRQVGDFEAARRATTSNGGAP
jgi:Rrf2 family iron-sulfur cluster assembly transcriptional regulator